MLRLLLSLLLVSAQTLPAEKPNVVIIFCDDLGYGDIGPFGQKSFSTPHLDKMAAEGRTFKNFHVSTAVCSASRASLLTGCYNTRLGIQGAFGPGAKVALNPSETTIAELLKNAGYSTGMAGKWHLGDQPGFLPLDHGFDEWLGLPYSNDMWPHHPEAKPGNYPKLPLLEGEKVIDEEVTPEDQRQLTTRYTDRAVGFIERNKDRPFFFYLAHNMPHVPLFVSDKFAGKSGAGLYGDVIQEIDWSVGQVLSALKKNGIDEKTLVIFTSDNGPWLSYGEHSGIAGPLREGKGTSWEGGTRVPCIMRWPGKIPAATETGEMAMTIDLLPTIAGFSGATLPQVKIDGANIETAILASPNTQSAQRLYATWYSPGNLESVTDGRWKLMLPGHCRTLGDQPKAKGGIPAKYQQAKIDTPLLFDLHSDIGETTNVAAGNPDHVARLSEFAEKMRRELGDKFTKMPGTEIRPPARLN
jgi:arylsulfatase A